MNRWTRDEIVIEACAWFVILFLIGWMIHCAVIDPVPPSASPSSALCAKPPPQPRWSPLIPRREEEADAPEDNLDDTDLAIPGQYAANHSITNAP